MIKNAARSFGAWTRRLRPTPSILVAAAAVFLALGGSAVAATGLIRASEITPGAITSKAIRNGAVEPQDLSTGTRALLAGGPGAKGDVGPAGTSGGSGSNGANGPNGANGATGVDGTNGADGAKGTDGTDGIPGTNGTDGTNGTNGTIAPLSATKALTPLPTASPPVTVVELTVPAGNYVVLAKTELFHSGAGDSVECTLRSGTTTLDQIAMKTLPALAAIPASMQAVTTAATSPTVLSVQCSVLVANGSASSSSLIAIPTA
jgi:hypothetical protein